MTGDLNPKIPIKKNSDSTLTWSPRGMSVNLASTFAWTGTHTFSGAGSISISNGGLNVSTSLTLQGNLYNYTASWYFPYWTQGAIPFVNDSNWFTHDPDDFFRNNAQKRYGFGIGLSDTLEAKVHVVGQTACGGTPTPCVDYTDQSTCNSMSPCYWTSYGSCYQYTDETNCNYQTGCLWDPGTECSTISSDYTCNQTSPCYWQINYGDCSDFNDNQYNCDYAGGGGYCYFSANSCSGYYDEANCNNSSPCYWTPTMYDCSNVYNQYDCDYAGGGTYQQYCSWNGSTCDGTQYPSGGGTCDGDNSYCSGTTYPSSAGCIGGYYGSVCNENYYCGGDPYGCNSWTDQASCEATGCTWEQEPALKTEGKLIFSGIPTSDAGLSAGDIWNDSGTLKII